MNPDFFERQSRFPSLPPITHLQNLMYRAFEARQLSYLKERQSETPFLSERKAVSLVVNYCFAPSALQVQKHSENTIFENTIEKVRKFQIFFLSLQPKGNNTYDNA